MDRMQEPQPFLKWAGGKRQLLAEIINHVPTSFAAYYEPFVGAGALFFRLQPTHAVINDINSELVNCYWTIKNSLSDLLEDLAKHKNEETYFYRMRDLDRNPDFVNLSSIEKASRIIYLNKTCYNGLFRVNSQGQFNTPFGHYANPKIRDEGNLRAVSQYLAGRDITIDNADFESVLMNAAKGDFVYLDPPYDPISYTSSFTGYSLQGFSREEQERLKRVYDDLTERGCYALLSNSASPFILELYKEYTPIIVSANRAINSNASRRGKVDEVLVKNYA
ncbi:MAG: DNA adenine methylase [Desulfitobacteriaceae bacterium]